MRGCGAVPEDAVGGLNKVVDELSALLHNISHSIREELGLDQESHFIECKEAGKELTLIKIGDTVEMHTHSKKLVQ